MSDDESPGAGSDNAFSTTRGVFHKALPLRARELASDRRRLCGVLSMGNSNPLARFLPLNTSGVPSSAFARGVDVELLPESDGDGSGSRTGVVLP